MRQHICRAAIAAVAAVGLFLTACSSHEEDYVTNTESITETEETTAITQAEYGAEDFIQSEKQTRKPKETQPVTEVSTECTQPETSIEVQKTEEPAQTEHVHNYTGQAKVAATEYAPGIMTYTCSTCSKSYEERYALPHTIDVGGGSVTVCGYWDKTSSNELMKLLNEYRKKNNLNVLNDDAGLENTARLRAVECSYLFSHKRPNSDRCFTLYPEGYKAVAENIASGYGNASETIEAWKNSNEHNKNMLNPEYNYGCAGVFVVFDKSNANNGNILYVQSFMKK